MANVAGTKATGPASKDAVSGGTQFPLDRQASVGGTITLGTSSDAAQRAIMGMRVSTSGLNSNVESSIKSVNKATKK